MNYAVGNTGGSSGASAGRAYGGALSPWSVLIGTLALGVIGLARRRSENDECN
jgi:hypothetical protein